MKRVRLSMREFVDIARRVIEEIDEPFRQYMDNLTVDVEREPTDEIIAEAGLDPAEETLMGLFVGRSIIEQDFGEDARNRILLFKRPIEEACRSRAEVAYEIRRTLIHELAHHFGYSEEDLEEYEARQSPFDFGEE